MRFPWLCTTLILGLSFPLGATFGIRGFVQIGEMGATLGEAWPAKEG